MSDQVTTSLAQAKVLVMQGLAGKAPRVNATNNHWEVYDNDTQAWVDTGVDATGPQGDAGYSPEVTITPVFNGRRIKITDKEHPQGQTFEVYNGTNGHSPYVNPTTGTWWYYDEVLPDWVDSGIPLNGKHIFHLNTNQNPFVTDLSYSQVTSLLAAGIEVECEITSGYSVFYAPLRRHRVGSSVGDDFYAFDAQTIHVEDARLWCVSVRVFNRQTNPVEYWEGSVDVPNNL